MFESRCLSGWLCEEPGDVGSNMFSIEFGLVSTCETQARFSRLQNSLLSNSASLFLQYFSRFSCTHLSVDSKMVLLFLWPTLPFCSHFPAFRFFLDCGAAFLGWHVPTHHLARENGLATFSWLGKAEQCGLAMLLLYGRKGNERAGTGWNG